MQFELDGRRMYINRDIRKSPGDEERDNAVRKLVEKVDADYRKGVVRYKDVRVGEYVNGGMELKREGVKLTARYKSLME